MCHNSPVNELEIKVTQVMVVLNKKHSVPRVLTRPHADATGCLRIRDNFIETVTGHIMIRVSQINAPASTLSCK